MLLADCLHLIWLRYGRCGTVPIYPAENPLDGRPPAPTASRLVRLDKILQPHYLV